MTEHAAPRSSEARSAPASARVAEVRAARPSGWWGIALFLAAETTLFGVLFGTYFYLRFATLHWPPPGTPVPETVVPLVLVGVLVTTSVPMQLAWRSAKARRARAAWSLLAVAFFVQCGYLAFELHDFMAQLQQFEPTDNAYSSIYYTLLGADHFHVFLGILLNLFLLLKLATGITNYRLVGLRAATLYWHVVNVITLLVIGALLSPAV